jgi:hypothetical protein
MLALWYIHQIQGGIWITDRVAEQWVPFKPVLFIDTAITLCVLLASVRMLAFCNRVTVLPQAASFANGVLS